MAKIGKEYIDDLTGLYNRRYLKKKQREMAEFCEKNIVFSLAMIDIDRFKEINDTYGHVKGDDVIREFAQFLKGMLRTADIVTRLGGDEFVCIMLYANRQEAEQIFWRTLTKCKQRKFSELTITISAGISSYPDDGDNFDKLLKMADASLYDAKRAGRDRIGIKTKARIEIPTREFIDRRKEKEALRAVLAEDDRRIRTAIIKGNVGIGKTRLVKEILNNLSCSEVLWSNCLAFYDEIPYYSIREIIRYKIGRRGAAVLDDMPMAYRIEIGKLLPELIDEIEEKIEEIGLVLDRYRLYESVKRIIEIGERRKVIVIDNMQWVDRETIEVIKYLLRSLRDNDIVFVLIYRQEEKTELLDGFTSYISREIEVTGLEIVQFEHNEITEIVGAVIGEEPGKELVEYIEKESGGNPFYIEAILKELNAAGYLKMKGEHWRFEKPCEVKIPKSIEDITDRKYHVLSKEGKEIIEIASVIERFDIEILKEITGYNEGHIIGLIEDIKRLGLIRECEDRIEFQEEVSRDAVYKSHVAGMKRRMLHRKVGKKLEEQYKGKEHEVIEELAFHYYRGAQKEKGVRYCIEAGDSAKALYANTNAIQYYTWAEELLRKSEEEEDIRLRIDCLLKRVDVLSLIGENEVALEYLEKGSKDAREIKDRKREVDIRSKRARIYFNISQYRGAIDEATGCMKTYKEIGDKKGTIEILNIIGLVYYNQGKYKKALKAYEDLSKTLSGIVDKNFEATMLNNVGNVYKDLGDYNQALKNYKESVKILKDIRNKSSEGLVLGSIGNIYRVLDNYNSALSNYADSLKICRDIGNKKGETTGLNNIGLVYFNLGDYDKAIKYYEDSLKIFRAMESKHGESVVLDNLGAVYNIRGDYNRALRYFEDAIKITKDIGDKKGESEALDKIGNIYFSLGDYDRALKYFEESLKIAEKIKSRKRIYGSLLSLANLYLTLNKIEKAKGFIDKAYNKTKDSDSKEMLREVLFLLCDFYLIERHFVDFKKTVGTLRDLSKGTKSKCLESSIDLLLGRHYTETMDFENARKHLNKALKVFKKIGERLNAGRTYYYMGMMELTMGKKSVCQKHLTKASEIFESLGAKGWKEKVEEAIALR